MKTEYLKTKHLRHQETFHNEHGDEESWGLLFEPGLGKSKTAIDLVSRQFAAGKLDGFLILAPSAVAPNWVYQELPRHTGVPHVVIHFETSATTREEVRRNLLLDPSIPILKGKLRVLVMNYDTLTKTDRGFEYAKRFVRIFRTKILADESTSIKSHSALASKRAKELREYCHGAMIATGTPAAQSPEDVHSQFEFLDPEFWFEHGCKSPSAFRARFANLKQKKYGARRVMEVDSWRDLDGLWRILSTKSTRLLKEDSGVELPPKRYELRVFDMIPGQRKIYETLKRDFSVELDSGTVDAPLAIVRLARLQQITSGFVTEEQFIDEDFDDDPAVLADASHEKWYGEQTEIDFEALQPRPRVRYSEKVVRDLMPPDENPRVVALREIRHEYPEKKTIVWTRFRRDVDNLMSVFGDQAVRYDGAVSHRDRVRVLQRFMDPDDLGAMMLVANVHAISQGVTLVIAKISVYYTNTFSLEKRLQSEDRNHRIGQDESPLIIDLVARDTVDLHVVESLREKYDISAQVTGDRVREWINPKKED